MSRSIPRSSSRNAIAPLVKVGRGCQQILVGDHLTRRGEQQRGHRLIAAHPVLRAVLMTEAKRPVGQVFLIDLGGRVTQHVGDDLVGLEERAQHGTRDERTFGPQQAVDVSDTTCDFQS